MVFKEIQENCISEWHLKRKRNPEIEFITLALKLIYPKIMILLALIDSIWNVYHALFYPVICKWELPKL